MQLWYKKLLPTLTDAGNCCSVCGHWLGYPTKMSVITSQDRYARSTIQKGFIASF